MLIAIAVARQRRASGVSAWTEGLLRHGLSPPSKSKSARTVHPSRCCGSGAGGTGTCDIHDGSLLALFTVHRQIFGYRCRHDFLIGAAAALRAKQKTILCVYYIAFVFGLQYFRLRFFRDIHKINITPRQNLSARQYELIGKQILQILKGSVAV